MPQGVMVEFFFPFRQTWFSNKRVSLYSYRRGPCAVVKQGYKARFLVVVRASKQACSTHTAASALQAVRACLSCRCACLMIGLSSTPESWPANDPFMIAPRLSSCEGCAAIGKLYLIYSVFFLLFVFPLKPLKKKELQ